MHEIAELADECTVFCNGRSVASYAAGTQDRQRGRRADDRPRIQRRLPGQGRRAAADAAPPRLEVRHLSWTDRLNDISLRLHAGEVIGLGGLDGQGQRELLLALFGVLRGTTGEVLIDGRPVRIGGPSVAKGPEIGMALIPEDRKTEGLMLPMSVRDNLSFAALAQLSRWGIVDTAAERDGRRAHRASCSRCAATAPSRPAGSLSGGNQQKLVIGKWLMMAPRIILLNDPTRGIDVGTKQEIYQLLRQLADAGAAILFYSTDYDELIGCCDRVLVMYDGAIRRELVGAEITEHALVSSALNIGDAPEARGRRCTHERRLALPAARAPRHAAGLRRLRRDVHDLRGQPPGRPERQRRDDRGQQGRAAGDRRDGADAGRADRGHRPVGRHGVGAGQLPRLDDRRRLAAAGGAGRAGRARGRRAVRRDQRADRDLRAAAADRHDDRHRRRVLRRRAGAAAACPAATSIATLGRRADRPAARRHPGEPGAAARRWCCSSGCRTGAR